MTVMFLFVQQSKTENGPAPRFSLLASAQGLTEISGGGAIHFSATFHAIRPLDRGTPSPEAGPRIYDLRFMSYDLRAEERDMKTRGKAKPESASLARRTCFGLFLRGLRVSVVGIRTNKANLPSAAGREGGRSHQTNPIWNAQPRAGVSPRTDKANLPGHGPSDTGRGRVQTKPICPAVLGGTRPGERGAGPLYKQTQSSVPSPEEGVSPEQTKPIYQDVARGRRDGVCCTNEADSGQPGRYPGADYAEQTQFSRADRPGLDAGGTNKANSQKADDIRGPFVRNEANSRLDRVGRGRRDAGRGSNVQNEPNLASRARPRKMKCAKPDDKIRLRSLREECRFASNPLEGPLGDSLHRARGMAQTIADVSAWIGVSPGRADARTELSVPA
jgi:hypothetical protein